MTITRTPGPATPEPTGTGGQAPERVSESRLRSVAVRLAAWVRHAPAERAPALGIPAVWTAAAILHTAGVSTVFAGAATVAAAGLAYGLGEKRTRAETERQAAEPGTALPRLRGAELAAATAGVGAWATAAAIWGPLAGPYDLLTAVYGAGTVGGYWWLRRHEAIRAARARRDAAAQAAARAAEEEAAWLAKRATWHQLAALVGLNGSHLMKAAPNLNGEEWVIDLYSAGKLADEVDCRRLAKRLAVELGQPRGRVEATPDPEWDHRLRILFRAADPWKGGGADGIVWHPWASGTYDSQAPFAELTPPQATIRDPIRIGADPETGAALEIPLWEPKGASRVIVIAPSGEGKSNTLDCVRAGVTICPDARLIQINLSKGVEESWWVPLAEASALASDANPAVKAQAILDFAEGAIRLRPNAAARKAGQRVHEPTPEEPLFVVIVDEADKVTSDPDRRAALERIESTCRSEGWALILATQRPAGKWLSTSLRANLTHLVWAKMRAGDARHAAGTENFVLPDMGAYGGDNPGVFGICRMPAHEGTAYLRGRTFFWGDDSAGLMRVIADRAATRAPYVLEPALAPLADLWASITGNGPLPTGDRYDLVTTPDGRATTGTAGIRARLAAVAGMLTQPTAGAVTGHGHPEPVTGGGDRDAMAELRALVARPGGVSVREAAEALPWQRTKVHEQLTALVAEGFARPPGKGPAARYYAATPPPATGTFRPLHAVPDPPEATGTEP